MKVVSSSKIKPGFWQEQHCWHPKAPLQLAVNFDSARSMELVHHLGRPKWRQRRGCRRQDPQSSTRCDSLWDVRWIHLLHLSHHIQFGLLNRDPPAPDQRKEFQQQLPTSRNLTTCCTTWNLVIFKALGSIWSLLHCKPCIHVKILSVFCCKIENRFYTGWSKASTHLSCFLGTKLFIFTQ
jgi:hypothetical protein